MITYKFKGIDCSVYGVIVRDIKRPVLASTADSYSEIPQKEGSNLFPGKLQDKNIIIECMLIESDPLILRSTVRNIAAWLYSEKREKLEFTDEPGIYYMAKLASGFDMDQVIATGKFTAQFRCEPLGYGTEQTASFVNDMLTINNPGTYSALPIFTATFNAAANEWRAVLGSTYVRVVRNFITGDELEVDCSAGIIAVNGARDMLSFDWQYSRFFALPPGEATLTIAPAGVCNTTMKYTPRWL